MVILRVLFFCMLPPALFCQNMDSEPVINVLTQYTHAVEKSDTLALMRLFHDDMVVTSTSGAVRNKREEIADLVFPGVKTYFFRAEDIVMKRHDRSAIAIGRLVWRINFQGKDSDFERRFTFAFALTDGGWKIAAQHIGQVPRK